MKPLFFALLLFALRTQAQQFTGSQISIHGGELYVHHPELDSLSGFAKVFQVDAFKRVNGSSYWHCAYGFPRVGFTLLAGSTGSKYLGNFLAGFAFLEPTLYRINHWKLRGRLAVGLSYLNKIYDPQHNSANQLIGTHINYALQGSLSWGYQTAKHEFGLFATMTHFSNAAFLAPNKGINMPTYGVYGCYRWSLDSTKQVECPNFKKSWLFHLNLGGGIKQIGNFPTEPQFLVWSATAFAHKRLSYISAIQFGASVFGDGALKHQLSIIQRNDNRLLAVRDHHTIGLLVGYEARMERLAILIQVGAYIYDPIKFNAPVFQRYGLKYYATQRIFVGGNLKAHFGAADFAEWNIGYVLGK